MVFLLFCLPLCVSPIHPAACVVYISFSQSFFLMSWSLIIPSSISFYLLFSLPSLLAYLHGADVREPFNGIMVAFPRNQREQTGFLGLGVPLFTASRNIQVPHSLSLSFSSVITAVSTALAALTNPKEHIMTHQSLHVCLYSSVTKY